MQNIYTKACKNSRKIDTSAIAVKSLLLLLLILLVLSGSTSAMSSETPSAADNNERLLLQDASAAERDAGTVHQLDMSSGAASISLGPVVVNEDGTLACVTNWNKMTDGERETTMRVLTKRNASRLKKLQEEEAAKAEAGLNETKSREQHAEL